MTEYSVIGKDTPQIDSREKVSGQAKYVDDLAMPGMLWGKTLRSPYPHARIVRIDTTKAEKFPGVKAVVTAKDYSGKIWGQLRGTMDRYFIPVDRVRFVGEEIAGVAAVDEETAEEAISLIEVEYEELPAVFDAEEAMKEGAPLLHEDAKNNVCLYRLWNFGNVEKGFEESDYVREDKFTTQLVSHACIEPTGCIASFDAGRLTVWAPHQRPFPLRRDLANVLELPFTKVRVIVPFVGGGFGQKGSPHPLYFFASLLAMKSGKPVKIMHTKEEQFTLTTRRLPMTLNLKTGVKKDGTLVSQSVKVISNGGAYADIGSVTIYNTGLAFMLPYRLPNFTYEAFRVYTNNPVVGAQRGHGQIQSRFAMDTQLDMICEDLGLDPIEVRLKNALQAGEETVNGLRIISSGLKEAIEKTVERSGWKQKRGKRDGHGIGIGCGGFACGAMLASQTDSSGIVKLNEDGTAVLLTGAVDIGQGIRTVGALIVAEILGIRVEDVYVAPLDTDTVPYDSGSISSRVTFYAGNAIKRAAEDVRNQLAKVAAARLLASPENIVFRDRSVYAKGFPERKMSFATLVRLAQTSTPTSGTIIGRGTYFPPNTQWPDPKASYAGNISGSYSFSTQIAEVEVDKETGQIRLIKMTAADDIGYPINALAVTGQAQGSTYMGQGQAMFEEIKMEEGKILNPTYKDYRMPTAMDTPDMEILHIITNDPEGPFGGKEVGEGFIISSAPAIANAIHDATGVWVKELPITPDKLLKALRKEEE